MAYEGAPERLGVNTGYPGADEFVESLALNSSALPGVAGLVPATASARHMLNTLSQYPRMAKVLKILEGRPQDIVVDFPMRQHHANTNLGRTVVRRNLRTGEVPHVNVGSGIAFNPEINAEIRAMRRGLPWRPGVPHNVLMQRHSPERIMAHELVHALLGTSPKAGFRSRPGLLPPQQSLNVAERLGQRLAAEGLHPGAITAPTVREAGTLPQALGETAVDTIAAYLLNVR